MKCMFVMVQLISKQKVCHYIATQFDMHAVNFMPSYAIFNVLIFNGEFVQVLITFNETEVSDRKRRNQLLISFRVAAFLRSHTFLM